MMTASHHSTAPAAGEHHTLTSDVPRTHGGAAQSAGHTPVRPAGGHTALTATSSGRQWKLELRDWPHGVLNSRIAKNRQFHSSIVQSSRALVQHVYGTTRFPRGIPLSLRTHATKVPLALPKGPHAHATERRKSYLMLRLNSFLTSLNDPDC